VRILNVIRSLDPMQGGPAEGLRQSVLATSTHGHIEEVLTLDAPGADWVAGFPATVHALGPVATSYGYSARLVPWLRRHAPSFDAVVVHGLWQYHGFAVWRALRGTEVPYFVYSHGMLDPWFKHRYPFKHLKKWLYWPWADYRVTRDAKAMLFTASEEAALAPKSFWLYRATPAVVGYGIALDPKAQAAGAEEFHRAFPATRGTRTVLFLARLHRKKGCDVLIEAFAHAAAKEPALHLVMAGPDQEGLRASLEARATRLGIAQRVTWTGMLQGSLKWSALRAAEVFVLPSHQENFGVAVVEALAMRLPVLISRRVNIWREIVVEGAGFADEDTVSGTAALLERWLSLTTAQQQLIRGRAEQCFAVHFHVNAAAQRLIGAISPHLARREVEPVDPPAGTAAPMSDSRP
jgi:glycosyltransferase involved in cell wall biosynthesis